jgi:2-polyprenyl-3-methyl-5-hydroxy-6-metoxy-1,4-benzoquinol methylase
MDSGRQTRGLTGSWDSFWDCLDVQMVSLYTRGRLRTIHQFWQRCYVEDLWACMGTRASEASYLELGAGRGTTSMYLTSNGCDVTMLDLSSAGFEVAKANFAAERLKLPALVQADARHTDLPSESFDCVFSIGPLEHFEDPGPVLAEAARLLRPGGLHFAVIIPDRSDEIRRFAYTFFRPWSLAWALMPDSLKRLIKPPRRSSDYAGRELMRTAYRRADYVKMLDGLDITEARCVPYNPYHSVYNTPFLETYLTIPAYRFHRSIKRIWAAHPLLATWPSLASCDLLTFRKGYGRSRE